MLDFLYWLFCLLDPLSTYHKWRAFSYLLTFSTSFWTPSSFRLTTHGKVSRGGCDGAAQFVQYQIRRIRNRKDTRYYWIVPLIESRLKWTFGFGGGVPTEVNRRRCSGMRWVGFDKSQWKLFPLLYGPNGTLPATWRGTPSPVEQKSPYKPRCSICFTE